MAIFLTEASKVIVQGITGAEGTKHTRRMVASGTNIVGGVNPRKAGSDVDGIPVFATVKEAIEATLDQIASELTRGNEVSLPGFGKFGVTERSARQGRNPQTGETIDIAATKAPKFSAASAFKTAVKS